MSFYRRNLRAARPQRRPWRASANRPIAPARLLMRLAAIAAIRLFTGGRLEADLSHSQVTAGVAAATTTGHSAASSSYGCCTTETGHSMCDADNPSLNDRSEADFQTLPTHSGRPLKAKVDVQRGNHRRAADDLCTARCCPHVRCVASLGITRETAEALPFLDFSDVRLVVLMHERMGGCAKVVLAVRIGRLSGFDGAGRHGAPALQHGRPRDRAHRRDGGARWTARDEPSRLRSGA